jgi:hypothetical protein
VQLVRKDQLVLRETKETKESVDQQVLLVLKVFKEYQVKKDQLVH